jgi:hypothetical protein
MIMWLVNALSFLLVDLDPLILEENIKVKVGIG